jgi:Zn-dependent protease
MINVLLALMFIASFLVAVALHEFAHAVVASWLGDQTPYNDGRRTLNIRDHIDPVGLLLCVILAFQPGGGAALGWGRPVKTDPWKLRGGPNFGTMVVALAGPIFSLIVGLLAGLLLRVFSVDMINNVYLYRIPQFVLAFAIANIGIAILNIVPIYPLDGYQILYALLPSRQAMSFAKSAPYGPFIILAIFFLLPFLGQFIGPLGALFIFHLASYITQVAGYVVSLVAGPTFDPIGHLFFLR